MDGLALGIDFGTSGVRAALLNGPEVVARLQRPYPQTDQPWPQRWQQALRQILGAIPAPQRQQVARLAIDGTSSTVLLCDAAGEPLTEPLFYSDSRGHALVEPLSRLATVGSPALSSTSSLVKLRWWQRHLPPRLWSQACHLLHQADWLAWLLHGRLGLSDYHNALKLGYDVAQLRYPDWLQTLDIYPLLPQVHAPGSVWGPITPEAAESFQLPTRCQVCAGTTDSIAAFLASGASQPGEAVTSLGSTLVLKLLSPVPLYDSRYGIYSHRLENLWLAGGASNSGGAVLAHFFSPEQLGALSRHIDPSYPTGLRYYPLLKPGERFPVADPHLPPQLEPRPPEDVRFLQGLLEGMARIEARGYGLLAELGGPTLQRVYTAGGGAQNVSWSLIRQGYLGCPVVTATHTEAAVGAARLAQAY